MVGFSWNSNIYIYFENMPRKFKLHWSLTRVTGIDLSTCEHYDSISLYCSCNGICFRQICRENQNTHFVNLMFIGPCIIAIVDEWKTNLLSLAILFHLLCAQHVSDINISIFRSFRLCWWITTSVVLFCKDGCFSVSVNLRCVVVCLVWCVLSPCCSW